VLALSRSRLVVVGQQPTDRPATVDAVAGRPVEQAHHHLVVHAEMGTQRFGLSVDQLGERLRGPVCVATLGLLLLHDLLAAAALAGLLLEPLVLDDVSRCLHPDVSSVVEPLAPGASGDLRELAIGEQPDGVAVVLAQLREQHRSDRHVDPDAEGVGAADDLEQPVLGELLDEQAVLGEQPGVVDADAGGDEPAQVPADR